MKGQTKFCCLLVSHFYMKKYLFQLFCMMNHMVPGSSTSILGKFLSISLSKKILLFLKLEVKRFLFHDESFAFLGLAWLAFALLPHFCVETDHGPLRIGLATLSFLRVLSRWRPPTRRRRRRRRRWAAMSYWSAWAGARRPRSCGARSHAPPVRPWP